MKALLLHAWRTSRAFQAAVLVIAGVVAFEVFGHRAAPPPPPDPAPNPAAAVTATAFPGGPQVQATGPNLDPVAKPAGKFLDRAAEGGGSLIETAADTGKAVGKFLVKGVGAVEDLIPGAPAPSPAPTPKTP